jgi:hypothetical protein
MGCENCEFGCMIFEGTNIIKTATRTFDFGKVKCNKGYKTSPYGCKEFKKKESENTVQM